MNAGRLLSWHNKAIDINKTLLSSYRTRNRAVAGPFLFGIQMVLEKLLYVPPVSLTNLEEQSVAVPSV